MPGPPEKSILDGALRRIIQTAGVEFLPYDRYGVVRDDMQYLPLGGPGDARDAPGGCEIFLLRMAPGAASTPHQHTGGEAFYVLEGELTDCDGAVFRTGDYVCYRPGSRHFSASQTGCKLLVILGGRNMPVD